MKILNAMFAKGLGGIEQAFVDYTKALLIAGHEVIAVIQPKAKIFPQLETLKLEYPKKLTIKKIPNLGWWDISAILCLECVIRKNNADIVIAHGNRPTSLLKIGARLNKAPLVSVAHNYKVKSLLSADYIFSITNDLKEYISEIGFETSKIFVIPNMMNIDEEQKNLKFKKYSKPPVVGVVARFVKKKGVNIFIEACSALKSTGVEFEAVIGGTGDEAENLQELRDERGLNGTVRFIGWVKDKQKFYNEIDIFCLPSLHEPFGIVILEAMMHKKPIVSTKSEGPIEILDDEKDALLVEMGHSGQLALALKKLIEDQQLAKNIAEAGYKKLLKKYDVKHVSKKIDLAVEEVKKSFK